MSDKKQTQNEKQKVIHLTSENNKQVATKMNEISKMILNRNQKAYKVLSGK